MDAMNELKGIMGEDFTVLIDTFISDSLLRLAAIDKAITEADPAAIRMAAHTFKGSAGNLAATRLAMLCSSLEDKGLNGEQQGCEALRRDINEEFQCVRQLLKSA
jgi:HPt (histidine-containing phosphotransfer) domain-containing protein